jgi:hypothetical protein
MSRIWSKVAFRPFGEAQNFRIMGFPVMLHSIISGIPMTFLIRLEVTETLTGSGKTKLYPKYNRYIVNRIWENN